MAMEEDIKILQKADPAYQETLVCEVVPDPMEGEQTWPTDEEIKEAGKLLSHTQCFFKNHSVFSCLLLIDDYNVFVSEILKKVCLTLLSKAVCFLLNVENTFLRKL